MHNFLPSSVLLFAIRKMGIAIVFYLTGISWGLINVIEAFWKSLKFMISLLLIIIIIIIKSLLSLNGPHFDLYTQLKQE